MLSLAMLLWAFAYERICIPEKAVVTMNFLNWKKDMMSLYTLFLTVALLGRSSFAFVQSPPALQRSLQNNRARLFSSTKVSSKDTGKTQNIEFELHRSISEIPADSWDACLDKHSSPFLEHAWLRCLEESKCASPETGWVPQHISIAIDGKVQGYVPLYLKGHSMGEFIFDNAWADAAYQNEINYYPKLLVGVPFTPATGKRILLDPDLKYTREEVADLRRAVGDFLKQVAHANKISSVHVNFLTDEEAADLSSDLEQPKEEGGSAITKSVKAMLAQLSRKDVYLRRTSLQYHWTNSNAINDGKPYESFDDYLTCFKSKRRITIRRERRKVQEDEGIQVDAITGEDILNHEGLVERMFEIYVSTVDKLIWGRQYLNLEFFQLLAKSDFVKNLCFMCARLKTTGDEPRAADVFAGTFNIVKDGVFYGRYWGCLAGKEVKNLHFETCYWRAIEYCIQNGFKRMEPGAGGGGELLCCSRMCMRNSLLFRSTLLPCLQNRLQMGERIRPRSCSLRSLYKQQVTPKSNQSIPRLRDGKQFRIDKLSNAEERRRWQGQ